MRGGPSRAPPGAGNQPRHSGLAIATALMLRAVSRLALRWTEGLIGSILQLLGLDLAVPGRSTPSRRAETHQPGASSTGWSKAPSRASAAAASASSVGRGFAPLPGTPTSKAPGS